MGILDKYKVTATKAPVTKTETSPLDKYRNPTRSSEVNVSQEPKQTIPLPKEKYEYFQNQYSALDSTLSSLKDVFADLQKPFAPNSVENTIKGSVFGMDFVLPRVTGMSQKDVKAVTAPEKQDAPYKGLLKTNLKELNITEDQLNNDETFLLQNQVKDKFINDLNTLKTAIPEDISAFVQEKKNKLTQQKELERLGDNAADLMLNPENRSRVPKDVQDLNRNTEYNELLQSLDDVAKDVAFNNAPILYNNIDEALTMSQKDISRFTQRVGNDIENVTNPEARAYFKAVGFTDFSQIGQLRKDRMAYTGIQAEINAAYKGIGEDVKILEEKSKNIEDLLEMLKQNPTDDALIKEIQVKVAEVAPIKEAIDKKKKFITKLSESTFELPEFKKELENQIEIDENYEILKDQRGSFIGTGLREGLKMLSNTVTKSTKGGVIVGNEVLKALGVSDKKEYERTKFNTLEDTTFEFTLPNRLKKDVVDVNIKEGKFDINWEVVAPNAVKTIGEMYLMGGVGAPLAKYGAFGKIAGLYAGSAAVFGGSILQEELKKGLTFGEASAITGLRLSIEAGTELINLNEFIPFNGVAKGLSKTVSKRDFVRFVGDNWKTLFPKLKAKGINVADFLRNSAESMVLEPVEEVLADLGNYGLDNYIIENIKPDYSSESSVEVDDLLVTAFTTALTMSPYSIYQGYKETKSEMGDLSGIRLKAAQTPDLFIKSLDESLKDGYITKEYYNTAKQEIEGSKEIYNANKKKIDIAPKEEQPAYLQAIVEYEAISKQLLSETDLTAKEKLVPEVEKALQRVQAFDKEYLPLVDNPKAQQVKQEEIVLQNLDNIGNAETFTKATTQELETLKTLLGETLANPISENVKLKAEAKLKEVEEALTVKQTQPEQEEVVVSPIEQVKQSIQSYSKEELEKYNPFMDKTLSREEKREASDLKIQKLQEIADKEATTETTTTTEDGEVVTQGDALFSQMGVKPAEVVEETPTTELEAKKADIEKRIQEAEFKIQPIDIDVVDKAGNKTGEVRIKEYATVYGKKRLAAKTEEELKKLIKVEYDTELKALEQPTEVEESVQQTEVVTPQEVSDVKPQTAEKAEKEQEKEVVEKFTEPANPFKNGKVKTSNWNAVLSKITDLALPNYRVRVVNTNSLTLEQLPFQTKKYFEDQARIQKTTVEDVMSKDKGKMLVLTDKEGNYILEDGLPVVTNFPDGLLAEYKAQYERQGLSEEQYNDKINQIKQARKNNSTLLIERISNFPVEITQDSNELSVAVGTNDFSIAKGSKGFPVAMVGNQEVNLISRKLTENELNTIVEIAFNFGSSGVYSQEAVKLTTEQKNNSERYQKLQYLKNLIFTGKGITTSGKKKLNFEYFLKSKNPEEFAKYGFSTKITYGNELVTSKEQLREILKNYSFNEINVNKDLSESLIKFTTYKIEDGKTVVDKTYPTYKDFLKDTIKTKGVSATKLQDNFYIEVGDTDGTLSAKLEEAKNEPAVAPVVEVVKPTPNTEIVGESQAVEEVKSLLDKKKKKSLDAPTDKDNFAGLLRSKKLPQEVIAEQNKKAKEWFDKSPLAEYISLNQLQNIVNSDAYASWNWGAITLFKGSQYTDLYHEAWHEFSQLYLTKKQKEALYSEIKNLPQYKDFTNEQIEEVIAEDFRNYAKSDGKLILNNRFKRNSTFRKVWNFLKELFTKTTDLQTVYERLYTGNISKYKRNTNNAFWGNLNLGIQLKDNKQLSDTDTKNLYRAIDSLIGTIFQQNGKPVTMMFADNKVLATVYGAIYKRLATEYNDLYDSIEERTTKNLSQGEAEQLKADAQLLDNLDVVIENWNEIVKTHRQYSAFFNISKDKIAFDEEGNITSVDDLFTEETDEGNSRNSEVIKNENVFSKEMASNETIFTIATLRRYNSDGTIATNPFLPFVADIVDFNNTWDKLTTSVNNTLNYDQLIDKITELGEKDKSFKDLQDRLPDPNKTLSDDEQRMKGAFMNDISKPLVNVYELVMKPLNGKMLYSYNTAASSDVDKVKKQWNDNFESGSPFIKQHPDDSLYTDIAEIKATYSARGTKPAFYYNKADYNKADKTQMFENRIDFLSNMGIKFTEDLLSDIDFKDFIIQDFVKTDYVRNSPAFAMYDLITNAKGDISSLTQLYDKQIAKPSTNAFKYYAPTIEALANYEVLGSNSLFAQSVKNAANNSVWQIRQWNYITKIFNALNDVQKYPTYQDLIKEDWLKQFDFEANPYVKGIYLNTLFDLNPESATYGQRRVIKKGKQTIYPTISLHDYNGMRLNASEGKANEGKQTTGLTAFEKIVQNINSLLLFNTQENLRYGDKSSSYSTMISHYLTANGKLEDAKDRKSIISFSKFTNGGIAELLPTEAYKILVSNLKQEVIPMIRFKNDNVGVNLRHYNKNIKDFGTFSNILTEDTKDKIQKQIIDANVQDEKEISKILLSLPLREEFETYITTKSEQLSELLDTDGLLNDLDLFDPKLVQTTVKEDGKNVPVDLPKQSIYYAYIVNSLLYNMEHTKLISFDPRFYKTANDVIKRLSAWSATGNMFIVDAQTNEFIRSKGNAIKDAIAKKLKTKISEVAPDGSIRSVIFTDNKYSANKLLESYKEKFLATGKYTAEQLNTILKAYTKIEEGDGQGYVTLDFLRQSKLRAGSSHWTKEHEAAYQKEAKFINGESTEGMSLEEMTLFTVQKWQYAGIGLENGIPYPTFYKFSVVPLIPSAIEKTNFKVIHENLIKQNVGLGLFESGSKASSNQEVELNPDGSIKLDKNGNPITKSNPFYSDYAKRKPFEGEYTINNIFFQYLKEQVNIEPKLKGETMFSTQMRKLLHLNLYNNGVPNDVKLSVKEWNKLSKTQKIAQSDVYKQEQKFGEVIEKLVEIERNSLLKKMGATQQPDGNYKIDAEKLSEFFREEFIKRDLPNEVVNYLQAENGEFKFPIDAFKQRATIERIAYSIANKKLVQQKMTGEALIQVASTGFELTDKFSEVREDNDLPFYTEPGKAQKVKIAFTERWKPLLNLEYKGAKVETLDRLNEAIKDEKWLEKNRKVITIVGVRIPVQGLNSQEYMEVFHFLPESMGGVIIVSPALVAKSGGDFDVDKLTTFFPNIFENKYTGEVKLYNSKDIKFTDLELAKQLKEIKKPSQEKLSQFSKIRKELKTELDNYKKQKESIKLTKAEARTFLRKLDVEIALLKQNLQILEEVEFAVMQESLENQISEIIADVLEENIVLEATQSAIEQTKIKIKERINDANIQQKFILKSINESLESLKEDIEYTRLNIQTIDKSINPIKEYLSNIQELIYQSSPKKAYENELIDLIRETLSRAENFQQLVRPNDTDLLNNTEYGSEKLKNLFPKPYQDNTFTSVIDFASILEKFKSNLVGKSNLGIAAVNNVFFALAQRAGLRHNKTYSYRDFSGKFKTKDVEFYLPHNTIEEDGEQFVSLSGLNSKNSENYISDIISQYINGFVDVANDDWIFFINAVKEFAPTMLYTAMAGTNAKTTIAFFNQPIMRDYIKKIDKYKNIFTKFKDPQSFQLGNWKALEEAAMNLVWSDETLSEIAEKAIASTRPNRTPQPFLAIRKHILETVKPTFLTEKRLSEALYEDKPLSAEEQIFAILHFWELQRQQKIVTNLQRSLNSDTKKVGTGYSSKERQLLFEDVEKSGLFNTDGMYRMRNESTVRAFTNDKTGFDTFSQQLFTDVFEVTNHPTFSEIIRELIKNDTQLKFEYKFSELEKLVNTIKNDFITYLYQNQVLDGNDNLFKKMQPLFNPKSSMALELKNLKEKYPNLENQFPILEQLIPDNYKIGNKILKTNLKLKKALADKDELDNATRQMRELIQFSSNSYTPEQQIEIQQFTDRLIKFIIVQSGLNPSVYNLLDIVPNEYYTQNIKHIIKDVQKALDKDVNKGFSLKKEKKSDSQKNLEIFYNRFKIERPTFFNFTEDEEGQLPNVNRINQRGVNYYLPKTDITGAKAQEAEDKLLAYIPTLPSKSITTDKTNAQTIRKNPKSLAVVYDNLQESNTEALKSGKVVNFATMTAKNKETIDSQIDTIIAKSMDYETISFDTTKGYFQDIRESNPELFNYGSQRLKDTFGITNPNFEETEIVEETSVDNTLVEEVIEQPIQNKEGRTVAIIGTAGRSQVPTLAEWNNMLKDAESRVNTNDTLISGGAAFADHIAVKLFLEGKVKGLKLRLPAKIVNNQFVGGYGTAGGTANYYHKPFSKLLGVDTITEIQQAIDKGAEVTYETETSNKAMFIRNEKVAKESNAMIAYTYGESNEPADGGTKDTWNKSKYSDKTHVSISKIKFIEQPINKEIQEREHTPEKITELKPNEVFVFGSNAEGAHGKGAALLAKQKFGAKQGQSEGLQGQSYAIITKKDWRVEKSSTLNEIANSIMKFVSFASRHPDKKFYVTKIGSALAGYTLQEIKQVWKDVNTQWESEIFSDIPDNIILPKEYEIRDLDITPKEYGGTPVEIKPNEVKGIEINSYQTGLGNSLTNVHYAKNGKSAFDIVPSDKSLKLTQAAKAKWGESVEAWYKSNNAQSKGIAEGVEGDKYDMDLMVSLITDKLTQYPNLVEQINERGGLVFLQKSFHNMGNGRWSSKNSKNMFMNSLIQAYKNVNQPTEIKPKIDSSKQISAKGKMTFSYGNNKRSDVKSTTTFEAIKNGERTATTRYESDGHIDYWKNLKKGDIIEWESANGEKLLVEVTKSLHKLVGSGKTAEQWSKLEGWSVDYFNSKVKPKLNQAWQIEYKPLTQEQPIVEETKEDIINKLGSDPLTNCE